MQTAASCSLVINGRTIGWPTANVADIHGLLPSAGVYVAWASFLDQAAESATELLPAMVNIGTQPTIGENRLQRVEAHLIDWQGDAYHRPMRLAWVGAFVANKPLPALSNSNDNSPKTGPQRAPSWTPSLILKLMNLLGRPAYRTNNRPNSSRTSKEKIMSAPMPTPNPMIQDALAILRQTRTNLVNIGDSLSDQQLHTIPAGCNNNILWNLAHLPVTMCLLTRGLAGLELGLDDQFVAENRKGTSPSNWTTTPNWADVRELLTSSVDWVFDDFAHEKHGEFQTYPTSYGFELGSPAQALLFNNTHEALHFGVIMAYRHLV